MKHYTICLQNVEIFRNIFFHSKELFFGQGKERIFWNVFLEDFIFQHEIFQN